MVFGIVSEADAEIGGVNLTPKVSVHDAQRLPRQIRLTGRGLSSYRELTP
jgi:hypothetical protein